MERAMAEVTDKVSGRGVAGGRDNDGGRRRGRSGHGSGGEEGGASEGEGARVASGRVGGEGAEASGRRKPYPLARASPARWLDGDGRARAVPPGRRNRKRPGEGEWAGLAGPVGSGQALCTWPSAQWPVLFLFSFLF